MSWKDALFGTGGEIKALPTMSGQQGDLFSQMLSMMQGQMGQMGTNLSDMLSGNDEAFRNKAMSQFNEEVIPGIGERFSGMGAGAQNSSAFGQQLGQAGAGLSENLAMHQQDMKQQGMSQLMQMLGMGVQTPTHQYMQIPGQEGMMNPLMKGLGSGIGQIGGMGGTMGLLKALGLFK